MKIAVVGQGYVGLPVAKAAVEAGHQVFGFDIDTSKIAGLRVGRSPIDDVTDQNVAQMLATRRYWPTSRPVDLDGFDIAVVTVPTPLSEGRPDLTAVLSAARMLAAQLKPGALVVLESTVAPGTTDGPFRRALEDNPLAVSVAGGELHVGFSPERIDPGNTWYDFRRTPKLVSGITPVCAGMVAEFYTGLCDKVVPCASPAVAEMAKLLENTYRHVNIGLVNELCRHAHQLGISIWDVVDAASTKPYGYQAFYPGPGVGGHCLPVDPVYLSDQVERTLGDTVDFVDLAVQVNRSQPRYVVERAVRLLNRVGRAASMSTVLVLGVAYKANTADMRETPAAAIVDQLLALDARVAVCDPRVGGLDITRRWPEVKPVEPTEVAAAAAGADLTILVTAHDDFPYEEIAREAGLVLDTRNRFVPTENVHRL